MDITFIGTGSAWNHKDGSNSAFVEFSGTNILLDCGPDVPERFENLYGSVAKIDNIWISHMHGDHIGGLEEIFFKNKFMNGGKKVNLFLHESIYEDMMIWLWRTMRFSVKGPVSVKSYFNDYQIKDGGNRHFRISGHDFFLQPVVHMDKMPAHMFVSDNFVFTGDTQFINWAEYDLSKVKVIFQDTQMKDYGDDNAHTPLDKLLALPENVRQKIWCMHYGKDIVEYEEKIKAAGMKIVRPGMKIRIK